jgi:TetR/AcrR family transcriptional repressor of nem operon
MGHSKASKENTHARLVAAAASRFKERGIDGISLADLMKDLKLTHGGFYKHFASRDDLVAEALHLALNQSGEAMRERLFAGGEPDLSAFVDFYLAEAHRDARADGCAVAALVGDAARRSAAVQAQFRSQIESNLRLLGEALGVGKPAEERRSQALLILSALYGALMMARAVGDSPLSREILRSTGKRIRTLSGAAKKSSARARLKRSGAVH